MSELGSNTNLDSADRFTDPSCRPGSPGDNLSQNGYGGGGGGGGGGGSDLECKCRISVDNASLDAPNYGGRVPVDTTPGPAPVCRALKTHPVKPWTAPTGVRLPPSHDMAA